MTENRNQETSGKAEKKRGKGIPLQVIDIGLAAANIIQDRKNQEEQWIGTIKMANQRIEWTGAGYSFPKGGSRR